MTQKDEDVYKMAYLGYVASGLRGLLIPYMEEQQGIHLTNTEKAIIDEAINFIEYIQWGCEPIDNNFSLFDPNEETLLPSSIFDIFLEFISGLEDTPPTNADVTSKLGNYKRVINNLHKWSTPNKEDKPYLSEVNNFFGSIVAKAEEASHSYVLNDLEDGV
jgi:hypothetical protein